MFLYQKLIDRSTLRQGFQIPVEFHHLLKAMPGGMPQHGETRNVKVLIDGVIDPKLIPAITPEVEESGEFRLMVRFSIVKDHEE